MFVPFQCLYPNLSASKDHMLSFVEVSFYGLFCYDCELEESENDEIAYLCV